MRTVGRGYRRHRSLQHSSRGVVAVVGTLLSLLVFFALFGIFLTQYLPVWMSENESTWAGQVQASMAQLQSNIEQQVVLGAPSVYATPFVMDSQGIPLFASPTQGVLTFGAAVLNSVNASPYATYTPSIAYTLTGFGHATVSQSFPTGFVQMSLPNRYYVPQTYQLEDDAVIQSQSPTSQFVEFPPLLKITSVGGQLSVLLEIVQFGGNSTQSYFQGTQDLYSTYTNSQPVSYNNTTTPFSLTIFSYTHYPCAWWSLFNNTIRANGLQGVATSANAAGYCVSPAGAITKVSLQLSGVTNFTYLLGEITISTGVGVA